MPKIVLSGRIVVPAEDLDLVLRELPAHVDTSRDEPGCLTFEVSQDADNPNVFHVYEEFVDQGAFHAHQKRVSNSDWGRVSAGAERDYRIREGTD